MADLGRGALCTIAVAAVVLGLGAPAFAQTAGVPDCEVIESYDWDRENHLNIDKDTGGVACEPLPFYEGGELPVGAVISSGIVILGGVVIGIAAGSSSTTSTQAAN